MAINRTVAQRVLDILGPKYYWDYEGDYCSTLYTRIFFPKTVVKLRYVDKKFSLWTKDEEIANKLEPLSALGIIIYLAPYFYDE